MVMAPLTRKLLRDLGRLRGQIISIALVIACGVTSLVGLRSTLASLTVSRDAYYERYRFAEVFAGAERAPETLALRLETLPGVARAHTRVVKEIRLRAAAATEWASGRLISLPERGRPPLNDLHLRSGRWPDRDRPDEILVLDSFAEAAKVKPGQRLRVVVNGKLRDLEVVGTALSPEYVYALRPGAFSDEGGRFAILWMSRRALAAAFDQQGHFNDLSLSLQPGAAPASVIHAVDELLAPHGGRGAVARDRQLSNHILHNELGQLDHMATMIPAIFLAVAAFLVNVVLSRLVSLQRPEIAALKALGYRNDEISRHFFGLVLVTVALGMAVGTVGGYAFGHWMTGMYGGFFRFPVLEYHLGRQVLAAAALVSAGAALSGAWLAIRAAVRLPPAEAMRPPAPPSYRASGLPRTRWGRLLGVAPRMILRETFRRPLRTALSALGIAAAVGVLILGKFSWDSLDHLLSQLILVQQREDLSVTFLHPVSARALGEARLMPGVLAVEGMATVPVKIRRDGRQRDAPLYGLVPGAELRRIVELDGNIVTPAAAGLTLTSKLAELLAVREGDVVEVDEQEGHRRRWRLPVHTLADEGMGLQAYLPLPALGRLLREEPRFSVLYLRIDPRHKEALLRRLERSPYLASTDSVQSMVAGVRAQSGQYMVVITIVVSILAGCIAVGVVYNNARISLSQRSRDLASLRVLGFTRREISAILIGELGITTVMGLPLGLLLGHWWASAIAATTDVETIRLSVVISDGTRVLALGVALLAAVGSALWVRRRLDRLDLIAVLKTRE